MSAAPSVADRTVLLERIAERAGAVDRGEADLRDTLGLLAREGLLELAAGPARRDEVPAVVALVEAVAGECLSSAFTLWAHRMVVDYLAHAEAMGSDPERAAALGSLVRAETIGSTGMAPALRDLAGLGPVPLEARRDGESLRVSGPVAWASNLYPGALVVAPVRLPEHDGRARGIVAFRTDQAGVTVHAPPRLLALNATASSSMALEDVAIAPPWVLTEDMAGFVAAVRPRFLLVQSAFCLGLARRSLGEARERATGLAAMFADQLGALGVTVDDAERRLHDHAARCDEVAVPELLALRLDAAVAAGEATRLESCVRGGGAYVADSAPSRRLREAAFLPVQAPTEGQLRWQLSRSA